MTYHSDVDLEGMVLWLKEEAKIAKATAMRDFTDAILKIEHVQKEVTALHAHIVDLMRINTELRRDIEILKKKPKPKAVCPSKPAEQVKPDKPTVKMTMAERVFGWISAAFNNQQRPRARRRVSE